MICYKNAKRFLGIAAITLVAQMTIIPSALATEATSAEIQKQHQLTDDEIKLLETSSISHSQMGKVAQLSKASGKSIEDVLRMRTEQKMGWGKIAKELGVHPSVLGKSADDREDKIEKNMEKNAVKKERKDRLATAKEKRAEAKKNK